VRIAAALLVLLAVSPPIPVGSAASTPRVLHDTGERFRTPLLGTEFRVLADEAGAKAFRDAGGRTFDSVEDVVRAEEAAVPPVRRIVHPALWPLLDDPTRAAEPVRVILVLRRQPVRDAAVLARAATAPLVRGRLARMREILGGIAPLRHPDAGRVLQLGDRFEEEARLLTAAERSELKSLREEVQDLVRLMRREILDVARPRVALDQAPVAERVGALPGGRVLATSMVLSTVTAEVPAGGLDRLAADLPSVARIVPHGVRRPSLNTSVSTLGATTWTGAGYDGSSTTKVAVMDTGIDGAHPALSPILGAQSVHLQVGKFDPFFQDNATSTDDIFGHGSHVAGIVMSQDATYKGVAPGGVLMNAKCGYNSSQGGNLQDGDIMSAGDWAADNGADAVNASFGGGGPTDGSSGLTLWFDALVDAMGVFAAIAAGNSGPSGGTVGQPGDTFNGLTVGSLDDKNSTTHTDNVISSFSSRGPLDDGRRKPDLCAPGSQIMSVNFQWEGAAADFVAYDGTSMATPHMAGAAALLLDYAASWRPEGLKALLLSTTRNTSPYATSPDNTWGYGAADLAAAFTDRATVKEGQITSSGPAAVFIRMPALTTGKRATLCWNRDLAWNDASTPTSYRAMADLDLYVYEEADQTTRGSSTAGLSSVEQVALSSNATFPLLKVKRFGSLPSGQATADFAVAAEAAGSSLAAAPPALTTTLSLGKAIAKPGDTFTVEATLAVGGDLPAFSPQVVLALPPGYAIDAGANPQALQAIAAGASRKATWTVTAGGSVSGDVVLSATGSCNSYGESFASPAGTSTQPFDALGPTGTIQVQSGAAAVAATGVTVQVFASDDSTGVTQMRVRNSGDAWGEWQAYAASFPWTLSAGEGVKTVDVQLMDAAGNPSGTLQDSLLLDLTAPTGTFTLSGGAAYILPWQDLTADTVADDGAEGSGVTGFRVRWGAGMPWSDWIPLDGDPVVPLPRPLLEKSVLAEGQVRDAAGNASSSSTDSIYLVEADPPSLASVKTFKGTMKAGGDYDAFTIGALPGDVFSVKIKAAGAVKGSDFQVETDLYDPSGASIVKGRFPVGARKPGISKFYATFPGEHWIVLRPGGAAAAAGGTYTLSVKSVAAKANKKVYGPADPVGGEALFTFQGSEGSVAVGKVRGPVGGTLLLEHPDGSMIPVAAAPVAGGVKISGMYLDGTGTFVLHVPATGPLLVDLKLKPPRRTLTFEAGD
jgi:serine protease AprX